MLPTAYEVQALNVYVMDSNLKWTILKSTNFTDMWSECPNFIT